MSTDKKMNLSTKPVWHDLVEQATREGDGEKLCRLVEEICDSIDAQAAKKKPALSTSFGEEQGRSAKNRE